MDYNYKIISIDEKQRWIFLQADEWDLEEPDSFNLLIKMISEHVKGDIIIMSDDGYRIKNDPCNLIYQWDSLFGITIIYPSNITSDRVVEFLAFLLEDNVC